MSAEVWFYHLERQGLGEVLPVLLEKCLERGWRALVRLDSYEDIERLDNDLWVFRPDSFLPHGFGSGPEASRLPILLATDSENVNGAQVQFVAGLPVVENPDSFERIVILLDGRNQEALSAGRLLWRAVKASGAVASYWRQNDRGQWAKDA